MSGTKPVGIIRSVDMFRLLGTLYGVALNYKKRLNEVMYSNILIVDWTMKVDEMSRQAMARTYEDIYDDIVVTRDEQFIGVIPVYELLTFMTEYKLKEAVQQNPLTGLPGNERIHDYLIFKIEQKEPFSIIYTDVDHFKSYNDVYGFKYGDDVLKWVGRILTSFHFFPTSSLDISAEMILSHVFPRIIQSNIVKKVIEVFEIEKKAFFYSAEDYSNNYIQSLDRDHKIRNFPLISLSMAILNISSDKTIELSEISRTAAKFKKARKANTGKQLYQGPGNLHCQSIRLFHIKYTLRPSAAHLSRSIFLLRLFACNFAHIFCRYIADMKRSKLPAKTAAACCVNLMLIAILVGKQNAYETTTDGFNPF